MKANEAPEKIYLVKDRDTNKPMDYWYSATTDDSRIEYIRKDAFMKKVFDAYCKVCGHYHHTVPTHICRQNCDYFSDFKKYMGDSL